jgi:urea ABC transporter ATP-binding protein UrtE
MLSVHGLQSGYGNTMIVRDFDFEIKAGEKVGLLGRNGVGKTTALKTMIGLIASRKGEIRLDGQDITRLPAYMRAKAGMAYVPQGRMIFSSLSVQDNIKVSAYGAGISDVDAAIAAMYEQFPILFEKRKQPGGQLSGGQQQILAIARALVSNPKLILLDEPSEGIQPSIVAQIGEIITQLCEERGISIVLVEQNFDFAIKVVSKVFIMEKGKVVFSDNSSAVRDNVELQHKYLGL